MLFATALVDAPINEILRTPGVGVLMYRLVREALTVPRSLAVRLEELHGFRPADYEGEDWRRPVEDVARFYDGQIKVKSGVWRDLAVRHRPTEAGCQLGNLVEKGNELGLQLPLNARLVELIRQIEEGSRRMGWENLDELAGVMGQPGTAHAQPGPIP
jgi:2-dehydropantoate 2-reductase